MTTILLNQPEATAFGETCMVLVLCCLQPSKNEQPRSANWAPA